MITATQCRRRIDFSARDRHPQPLSRAGREASTKPPRGRTRRDSAPTVRKTPLQVVSPAFLERLLGPGRPRPQLTSRSSAGNRFRTCHWPGYPYASCIAGRKPAATWSSGVHRSSVGAGFPTCITVERAAQVGNLRLRCRPACSAPVGAGFFTCITVQCASQVGNLRLRCRPACGAPVGAGFVTCITVQCASQVGNLRLRCRPACIAPRRCRFLYLHYRRVCIAGRKPAATWSSGLHRSPVGAGFPTCTPSCGGRSPIAAKNPPPKPLAFADAAKVFRHDGEVFRRNGEALATQAGHRRTRREPLAPSFTTRFPAVNAFSTS